MNRYWMASVLAIVLLAGCGTKMTEQPEPAPAKPDAGSVLLPPPKEGSDAKRFDFVPGGETTAAADTPAAEEKAAVPEEKAKLSDPAPATGTPASVPKESAPAATPPPAAEPTEPPAEAPEPSAPVVPTPTMQEPPKAPASSATPSPTPKPAEQDLLTPPMAGGGK